MQDKIRVGVVGCGAIVRNLHLPNILTNDRFQLAGLVDRDLDAAAWIRKLFRVTAPIADSLDDIDHWDAALVAVPPQFHSPVSLQLLEKDIHVICEKPLATDMAEAQQLVERFASSGKILMVIMQKFYQQNTRGLSQILESGLLGEIKKIELECLQRSQWDTGHVGRFDPQCSPGGVTFENGIHWLYRMHYWFGDARIRRYSDDRLGGVEANAEVDCDYSIDGRDVPCKMYYSADHSGRNRLTVYGSNMNAVIEDADRVNVHLDYSCSGSPLHLEARPAGPIGGVNYGFLQLDHFGSLVSGAGPQTNPTDHSIAALDFLLECYIRREDLPQPWVWQQVI